MFNCLRLLSLIFAFLWMSACGFQPLHQKSSSVDDNLASTRVEIIANRDGQILHNHLRDKINPKGIAPNPLYSLKVELSLKTRTTGFTSTQQATYATIVATADYELTNLADQESLYQGTAESVTSYNKFVTPYTDRYSERDARERALADLSEEIQNALSAFFATR